MSSVPRRPAPPGRSEPREVLELRKLKTLRPELDSAVDVELALFELSRRIQGRVPLPAALVSRGRLQVPEQGVLLAFEDLTLEWSDFRFVFRETAEILRRAEILEPAAHQRLLDLSRQAGALEPLVRRFYLASSGAAELGDGDELLAETAQVFTLALRPFLTRAAEAVFRQMDFGGVVRRTCPLCGVEPDFSVITAEGDRFLVCGGCRGRWPYDPVACAFCGNDDRLTLVSRTSADHQYRLDGCDACHRYLKAYDEGVGGRPALFALDTVATLPLDVAAIQQGYR